MTDENKYDGHIAVNAVRAGSCHKCAFDTIDKACPHATFGPSCISSEREDGRDIIWVRGDKESSSEEAVLA